MLDFDASGIPERSAYSSHGGGPGAASSHRIRDAGSASHALPGAPGADSHSAAALAHWLILSLDHVGRGMLLVGPGGRVLHANRLALGALAGGGQALTVEQGRLCARQPRDDQLLADAIDAALHKGLRRMLTLGRGAAVVAGHDGSAITVAVLPIAGQAGGAASSTGNVVLISLPQYSRSKDLAVQNFAREHGCTSAETSVLEALLAGLTPEAIAQGKKVQLCTVRTQIGQLRAKTGSSTIRKLLDRVAALPPMMVVVQ